MSSRSRRPRARMRSRRDRRIERCDAMSGTTPPVIHRVTQLDLAVEPWSWPFAEERRADIDRAFRRSAAREAADVERPRAAGAQSGIYRGSLQRQLFRDRFRQLPGVARLGFSRHRRVQRLRDGRAALRRRRVRARRNGPAYRRMPGASIFPRERPISTTSGTARSTYPAASRAKSRRKPVCTAAIIAATRIGIASSPGRRSR